MYYANYNEEGIIHGFYHPAVHESIPEPNILISDEEWQKCINNQGQYMVDISTKKLIEAPVTRQTAENLLVFIRLERNRLLAECDWTQLPDSPLTETQRQAWKEYRQALRDFSETCDPYNPVWPEKPE